MHLLVSLFFFYSTFTRKRCWCLISSTSRYSTSSFLPVECIFQILPLVIVSETVTPVFLSLFPPPGDFSSLLSVLVFLACIFLSCNASFPRVLRNRKLLSIRNSLPVSFIPITTTAMCANLLHRIHDSSQLSIH